MKIALDYHTMSETTAMMYLGIIVLSAKLGGELAHRLRSPSVLGEIMAGILIGPVIGIIDMTSDAATFISYIGHLALLFLLFRIGLESNLRAMVSYGRKAFAISSAGIVLSVTLGTLWALTGIGIDATAIHEPIIVGLILVSTSVGITARVIEEMGKLDLLESTMIIEASMVDDILTLLILSIVLGSLGDGMSMLSVVTVSARIFLFIGLFVWVGRKILPKIIAAVERMETADSELIVVLSLACFAAVAAEAIGLAYIAGALLLGIILSDLPERMIIESRMEGLCNFLVPVFFVLVGVNMTMDDPRTLLVTGSIATVLAVGSKIVGCYLAARWSGFQRVQALRIGVGMIPRAEVSIVVATIALSKGLIEQPIFGMTIFLTVATAIITIILLTVVFSGEERVIDLSDQEVMEPGAPEGVRICSFSLCHNEDLEQLMVKSGTHDVLLIRVSEGFEHAIEHLIRRLEHTHSARKLDLDLYMLSPQWIPADN